MKLKKTKLLIEKQIKKNVDRKVLEEEVKKIIFKTHNLGKSLDNLTRSDYYSFVFNGLDNDLYKVEKKTSKNSPELS